MLSKLKAWLVGPTALQMVRTEAGILLTFSNKAGSYGLSLSEELLQDAIKLQPSPEDLRDRLGLRT